jgi:glycosyltransferase involved in cell wall biosynthesis
MQRKIGYISPSVHLLGARISLAELLINLDRTKYLPVVVCPKDGPLTALLKDNGIDVRIIRFGNWRKVKYWPLIPASIYNLTELGRQEGISLWHSNEFWTFPYVYHAAKRLKIPAICHFRCSRNPAQLPPRKIRLYKLHKADHIITVSESRTALFKEFPGLGDHITVIPNGVNISKFQNIEPSTFRSEMKIKDHEFLVGMVGLVSEHKGVTEMLQASAKLIRDNVPLKVVIVGPDRPKGYMKKMKELTRKLDLLEHVIFIGFRRDIANIMADLDLLVTPSREEAFGRVLIEAMAVGTPVVATSVGGIPEIISDPDLGVLIPPENSDLLASAILNLLNDPEKRQSMATHALEKVNQDYSIQLHVKRIENFYDRFFEKINGSSHLTS